MKKTCTRSLNAPDGAGCSPTTTFVIVATVATSLNAPDGAGCFPTGYTHVNISAYISVSMHLMMLGASRHYTKKMAESVAIVSMHLMVLGASRPTRTGRC